jgi:hypothetical protein
MDTEYILLYFYKVTVKLTPWNRVPLEKLRVPQLLFKKIPAFYGTRMFITVFKRAHSLPLPWTTSVRIFNLIGMTILVAGKIDRDPLL